MQKKNLIIIINYKKNNYIFFFDKSQPASLKEHSPLLLDGEQQVEFF